MNATIWPFLAKKGHSSAEVERMHEAWCKAVMLQVTLWSRPYSKEGTGRLPLLLLAALAEYG